MSKTGGIKIYVTKVDRELFRTIYIDRLFIHIGKYKEQINGAGIFNQVCDYFQRIKKINAFLQWLISEYHLSPENEIPDDIKSKWETKLILATRSSIYSEVLRVEKLKEGGYEFYSMQNKGSELKYICKIPGEMGKVIQYVKYNEMCNEICDRLDLEHPMDKKNAEISKDIDQCLRYKLIPLIDKVRTISNSKNDYCLGYYNIKCGNDKRATPGWDSFMHSVPNDGSKECFMAWIYSIFKDDNFGKQILWINGKGDSGKSKVVQALKNHMAKINPDIVAALPPLAFLDKFSSHAFIKKRLIIMQDCADRQIVKNQLVKNITGNDDSSVAAKGQDARMANIYSKLLISSNMQPWINPNKPEELSRMLYITLDPELAYESRSKWDVSIMGDWATRIQEELDDFIAKCRTPYMAKLMPDGHNIQIYDSMRAKLTTTTFLADNLVIWWAKCIRVYKPTDEMPNKILFYEDMCNDYKRFLGKKGRNPRYHYGILSIMMPFLLEMCGVLHSLVDTNNSKYIIGYEFVESNPEKRYTIDIALAERAKEIGKNGVPDGQIFAVRDSSVKQGWRACRDMK